jgi:hypothetical protein
MDRPTPRSRQQRPVPLLAAIASFLAGLATLSSWTPPQQLVALVLAMLAGLAATLAATLWWKLSIHTAAAGGTVAILALTFGPALMLALPTVAVVGRAFDLATTAQPKRWRYRRRWTGRNHRLHHPALIESPRAPTV